MHIYAGLLFLADGVEKVIAVGTFGRKLQCREARTGGRIVTAKIMRISKSCARAVRKEAEILARINKRDSCRTSLCVRMLEHFRCKGHHCIVFEGLGMSLRSFMKKHFCADRQCPHGFALLHVSVFTRQLLNAVAFMHDAKLVHRNLTPENIYLTDTSSGVITFPNGFSSPKDIHVKGQFILISR